MTTPNWMQSRKAGGVAAIVLLVAVVWIIFQVAGRGSGNRPSSGSYFLDLTNGELIVLDADRSPVQTQDGHEAVRAHVFSCSDCADESTHFIGYLTKYTPEALAAMDDPNAKQNAFVLQQTGMLMSSYREGGNFQLDWLSASSARGMTVRSSAPGQCENRQEAMECQPF